MDYPKLISSGLLKIFLAFTLLTIGIIPVFSSSSHIGIHKFLISKQNSDSSKYSSSNNDYEEQLLKMITYCEEIYNTDNSQADVIIREGFDIINKHDVSDSLKGEAYHLFGKILVERHENSAGIDTLLKAIELKEKVVGENHPDLSKTYNFIGIAYFQLRNFELAKDFYERSAKLLTDNNIYSRNLFDAYQNIAIIYIIQRKYNTALQYFKSNLQILDSLKESIDSLQVAKFYNNYGNLAALNGKLKDAIEYFKMAEAIHLKMFGPDDPSIASINSNKGINAYLDYDYSQATLYYKKALDIYLNNNSKSNLTSSYTNLSSVYFITKNYYNSIQYAIEGLKYYPDNNTKLILYKNLAKSYALLNDRILADQYFNDARKLAESGNIYPAKRISLFQDYADFLFEQQDFAKSKLFYDRALSLSGTYYGESSAIFAMLLSKLGNYFLQFEQNTDSASAYFDKSIRIWNNLLKINQDSIFTEQVNKIGFVDAYSGKAQLLYRLFLKNNKLDDLTSSFVMYEVLLDRVDQISKNLDKENSYLLLEKIEPVFDQAIEVSYELYNQTNEDDHLAHAFELSERSKSSVLLNSIQKNNNLKTAEVPLETVAYDQELQEEIHGLRHLLAGEQEKAKKSKAKISFFNSRLLELMIKQDSLIDEIEKNYPKYYALKYDRSVIDVDTLNKLIENHETILEYVLSDSAIYIFAISRNSKIFKKVIIDSTFYPSLQYLIDLKNTDISALGHLDSEIFIKNSSILWGFLIDPVYNYITDKHLVIIPDGLLGYLSFEVLVNTKDQTEQLSYRNLHYLLKEFPISYSYSSSLKFNSYFKKENLAEHNLLAFSPTYTEDEGTTSEFRNKLQAIPNAASEVMDVQSIFGGEVFMGDKATRNNFLENASKFKIIHLAMHALINDSLPMLSELVFTELNADTIDNIIHTYEIFGLNLNAEMVTLSACNTGTGKLQKGEGILSLARGFIYAGVPSIIMTLWEIQDRSGLEIMNSYYGYLKGGDQKDLALQKAKLDYLDNANMLKSHPYYWSSYIVSGDTSPIKSITPNYTLYIVVGLLLIILVIVSILLKKSVKTD